MPWGFQTAGPSQSLLLIPILQTGSEYLFVQTVPMCEEIRACFSQKAFLAVKVLGNPLA